MNRHLFAFFLILAVFVPTAWAKEGGDQYPNGAENWFAGSAPPSGSYFVNFFGYYGGKLKDGSGQGAIIDGAVPTVNATFDAFRFVQMSHWKILGADYDAHVIVPVVHQAVNVGGSASYSGVGDIIVNPVILGWHRSAWHALTAVDIFLPPGTTTRTTSASALAQITTASTLWSP
jgi:hypothetical protein